MKPHWTESVSKYGYRFWTSSLPAIALRIDEREDNGGHSIPKSGRPTRFTATIGGRGIYRVTPAYSNSDTDFATPEDAAAAVEKAALKAADEILRTLDT